MSSADEPPDWWRRPRTISVVVDTPGWFDGHAERLVEALGRRGERAGLLRRAVDVPVGGVAFYLSCTRLTPPEVLARSPLNVVVHASDLPRGRGFSPIVWQVLEGRDRIPVCAIEAVEAADEGDVLARGEVRLEPWELNDAIRGRLGDEVVRLCEELLERPAPPRGEPQRGTATWYRRRGPADSRLDPDLSLREQFPLLRVVDNERYPAFFELHGRRFRLRIDDVGPAAAPQDETP